MQNTAYSGMHRRPLAAPKFFCEILYDSSHSYFVRNIFKLVEPE